MFSSTWEAVLAFDAPAMEGWSRPELYIDNRRLAMVRSDLGTHSIGWGVELACEPHHAARRCALSVRRTADLEEVNNNCFGGAAVRSERTDGNCAVHSSAQDVCCRPPRHVCQPCMGSDWRGGSRVSFPESRREAEGASLRSAVLLAPS